MKTIFTPLIVTLFTLNGFAQDQHLVDSLETALKNHNTSKLQLKIKSPSLYDTTVANILFDLSFCFWSTNPDKAMGYANQCLAISEQIGYKTGIGNAFNCMGNINFYSGNYLPALEFHKKALKIKEEIGDKKNIASAYGNIGSTYNYLDNYPESLKNHFAALKISEEIGNKKLIANSYNNIGNIYLNQGNYPEALKNHLASLKIKEEIGDKKGIAASYNNIGNIYIKQGNYSEALKNHFAALKINRETGNKNWEAINLGNIGLIYYNQGNYPQALKTIFTSLKIQEEIGNKNGIAHSYINIGETYTRGKKYNEASEFLNKGLSLSKEIGSLECIRLSYEGLANLDSTQGNFNKALQHYKLFITYRDSVLNNENTKKTVALQMNYDFEKKQDSTRAVQDKKDAVAQKEMQKQKLVLNGFMGGFAVVLLFAGIFFTQRNKIKKGKKLSDELLLNILPEEVAEELKAKGSAEAKQFDEVTVMFTDFKGFTQISEKLSPSELVAEIHTCFKAFDNIIDKYNIEKIKTIGDSYMCAGGLPVTNTTNAVDVVNAALDIQQFMQQHFQQRKNENKEPFEIRIGVHTGAVVAGIVGVKKFAYDIWGDTVNIASRMETSGEAGKVNISGSTYELVRDKFSCTHRGKIQAKNKGEIDMYFVETVS